MFSTGDLLCFVHADSRPPLALVRIMRTTLADPRTVLAGEPVFVSFYEARVGKLIMYLLVHAEGSM